MHKIMIAVALVFASVAVAMAQDAPKSYTDALRQCGAEWRTSEARKAVTKGQGMAAWQEFRRECVKRVGYVSKRAPRA